MRYILVSVHFCILLSFFGRANSANETKTINVFGKKFHLPLKFSFLAFVYCNVPLTGPECPRSLPEAYGPQDLLAAVILALQDINRDPDLWPFHNTTMTILDTQGVAKKVPRLLFDTAKDDENLAYIGLEENCDQMARIAETSNKLLISHYCTTDERYSTFVQLNGRLDRTASAIVATLLENGWDRVVIIYFLDDRTESMVAAYRSLNDILLIENIQVVKTYVVTAYDSDLGSTMQQAYTPNSKSDMIVARCLRETYLLTRTYVILSTSGAGIDAYYFLEVAGRMGLLQTGEYAVLIAYPPNLSTISGVQATFDGSMNPKSGDFPLDIATAAQRGYLYRPLREQVYQNYRSALIFSESAPRDPNAWDKFAFKIWNITSVKAYCPPFCVFPKRNPPPPPSFDSMWIQKNVAKLYEGIMNFARLISKLIKENNTDITDGYMMQKIFYNLKLDQTTSGVSILLDGYGIAMENVTMSTATYGVGGRPGVYGIGSWYPKSTGTGRQSKMFLEMTRNTTFNWVNGAKPPPGPSCGYTAEKCPPGIKPKNWIIAIFVVITILIICGGSVYYWRRQQYLKRLEGALWKILTKDLIPHDLNRAKRLASFGSAESAATGSAASLRMRNSQRLLKEEKQLLTEYEEEINQEQNGKILPEPQLRRAQQKRSSMLHGHTWADTPPFSTALYKGQLVALKRIYKHYEKQVRDEIKKELLEATSYAHPNINSLLGIVYEPNLIAIVTEYCQKGSLKDILENDAITLDRIFQSSIVFEIIAGLEYIHSSSMHFHGRLKSPNILIDARWSVRLSEFGLFQFLENAKEMETSEEKCAKQLWTAPELLRSDNLNARGTVAGDIYAFGIILHEIFGRQGPFGDEYLDAADTIRKIKHPQPNEPFYRPDMRAVVEAPDYVRTIMQECWSENPSDRPSLHRIKETLKPLKEGLSENLIDNMVMMIQKYNTDLEGLVNERTLEVELEKQKCDALLSSMLPKKVADILKQGLSVEPERFDCVTIFFSDIVGFADLIRSYSAYQVIHFLHHTYSTFDSMIPNFDVYKVETIGDSYMVVSGLPVRNGDNHAGEIASMALAFRKAALDQKIKTPSGDVLQLRIGIHSGPCVAGVVGLKMPRYCLFGDTVNTASRMESNGQALKIHCSGECKYYLEKLGGYGLTERGYVTMKGKGQKLTYWLLQEDPEHREQRLAKQQQQK